MSLNCADESELLAHLTAVANRRTRPHVHLMTTNDGWRGSVRGRILWQHEDVVVVLDDAEPILYYKHPYLRGWRKLCIKQLTYYPALSESIVEILSLPWGVANRKENHKVRLYRALDWFGRIAPEVVVEILVESENQA